MGKTDTSTPAAAPKPGSGLSYKPIEPGLDNGPPPGGYNERALLGQPEWLVNMVHAMNEGRQEAPTPRSLGTVTSLATPEGRAGALLAVYNPNFDASLYPARLKMRESIASGAIGDGIQAANTVIQHASEFAEKAADLDNGRIPIFNWIANTALDATGSARPDKLRMAVGTLAAESRKVYAGSGGGTQSELDDWQQRFPVHGSPAQQAGAMQELVHLLQGRLDAVAGRINAGMQTNIGPLDLLNAKARASLQRLSAPEATPTPAASDNGRPAATDPYNLYPTGGASGSLAATPTVAPVKQPSAPDWKALPDGAVIRQGGAAYIKNGNDPSQWKAAP